MFCSRTRLVAYCGLFTILALAESAALAVTVATPDSAMVRVDVSHYLKSHPDIFMAGYGFVWVPPPFRADSGDSSVGYDVYDRFDLGHPGKPTLYGTEAGLKALALMLHRSGISLHVDFVMNHNGFSNFGTSGFVAAGGYPGFVITLPNDVDGDFHSAFAGGVETNASPALLTSLMRRITATSAAPSLRTITATSPAGHTPRFGRLANVPDPSNRRFYPQAGHNTIFLFDPRTVKSNIPVNSFNLENPNTGDPEIENALGYLMRNAQWLIQVIGVDGLRIDAGKHMPSFVLDFLDRAVYRQNPRKLLDGTQSDVFTYSEVFDSNPNLLLTHVKKTINHADPGRIGGNRDTLDFRLYFALKNYLERTGVPDAWQAIKNVALDVADDGLHNGSVGVTFTQNHDVFKPFALEHVALAYTLMMPGNTDRLFQRPRVRRQPGLPETRPWRRTERGSRQSHYSPTQCTEYSRSRQIRRAMGRDTGLFAFERSGSP